MKREPLVSIGIPTYDRAEGLKDTLECMIGQTYENIEIIISDNCSPDTEVSRVINEFLEKDSRIKYFRQEENIGAFSNFKFVEEQAIGEYFMWVADDDLWNKTFIQVGLNFLLDNPHYQSWFSTVENIDSYNHVIREYSGFSRFTSSGDRWRDIIKFLYEPEILGKANIFYSIFERKALKNTIEKYFINEKWGSDYCFNLAFLSRYNIYCSNEVLLQKRIKRDSDNVKIKNLIVIDSPTYHIFPFFKSIEYMKENFNATKSTNYWPIVLFVIFTRIFISLRNIIYFKFDSIKKRKFKI